MYGLRGKRGIAYSRIRIKQLQAMGNPYYLKEEMFSLNDNTNILICPECMRSSTNSCLGEYGIIDDNDKFRRTGYCINFEHN